MDEINKQGESVPEIDAITRSESQFRWRVVLLGMAIVSIIVWANGGWDKNTLEWIGVGAVVIAVGTAVRRAIGDDQELAAYVGGAVFVLFPVWIIGSIIAFLLVMVYWLYQSVFVTNDMQGVLAAIGALLVIVAVYYIAWKIDDGKSSLR